MSAATKRNEIQIAWGVVAAFISIPVAVSCIGVVVDSFSHRSSQILTTLGLVFLGVPIFEIPAFLFIGAPICRLFFQFGWLAWWQIAFGATLAGAISAVALELLFQGTVLATTIPLFGVSGFIAGIAFWYVGVYKRA